MSNPNNTFKARIYNAEFWTEEYKENGIYITEDISFASLADAIAAAQEFIAETKQAYRAGHLVEKYSEKEIEIVKFDNGIEHSRMSMPFAMREEALSKLAVGDKVHWTDPYAGKTNALELKQADQRFNTNDTGMLATGKHEITFIRSASGKIEGPTTQVSLINDTGYEVVALASELLKAMPNRPNLTPDQKQARRKRLGA